MNRRGANRLRMIRWTVRLTLLVAFGLMAPGCVSRMFYYPSKEVRRTPEAVALAYEPLAFPSEDGTRLTAWWIPAVTPRARGTVLHLHGNAQNMGDHFLFVEWLAAAGYNLLVFDYRGYGDSEGKPDRRGVYEDARAAVRLAESRARAAGTPLVVIGQSLGGANAVAVLGREPESQVQAIVIDSAFASYRGIVKDKIGEIPGLRWIKGPLSWWLTSDRHSALPVAGHMPRVPVLYMHGTADRVVPAAHSQALFEATREPRDLWMLDGAPHTSGFMDPVIRNRLLAWLDQALAGHPPVNP